MEFDDFGKLYASLLENGTVDEVVGYKIAKNRYAVSALKMGADDKEALLSFPLSQLMVYNYARTDSATKYLHKQMDGALDKKVGMVGRPCDVRGLVELAKRFQVNLDNIFTIVVEDQGRFGTKQLTAFYKKSGVDPAKVERERLVDGKLVLYMGDGSTEEVELGKDLDVADNCKRCFRKVPPFADITVSDIGLPKDSSKLVVAAWSEAGSNALKASGITLEALPGSIKSAKEELQAKTAEECKAKREKDLAEFASADYKVSRLLKCTMCGMCIRACPVCFCKDCVLQKKRKAKDIDKISYQLTRIAHVADSCVGCGACDIVCPMNLPLSLIFQTVNDDIAESFGFVAGLAPQDNPPRSGPEIKRLAAAKGK
ncbi:MAG: Coenzyme F420 hydrogenase/dehydrogenase, beta subunit C-terminal domain [Promethearchaeota archaeon]